MADWSKPTITSNYVTFVDEVKNRDFDAISLQLNALVNPPTGSIRLLRSPIKFQEWNGTTFVDKVLSPGGGGTGLTSLSGLGSAMGLGTMAYQNISGFNIGPGTISDASMTGDIHYQGGTMYITAGSYHPVIIQANVSQHGIVCRGADVYPSWGIYINAGTGNYTNEYALLIQNKAQTSTGLNVRGDMTIHIPVGMIIPVGANKWCNG
jgi:hypothetical protein